MNCSDRHPVRLPDEQLLKQCELRRTRRSGPGGQRRNKVETAVVLRHRPTGVTAEAAEARSSQVNERVALSRLRRQLAVNIRQAVEMEALPSELWLSRCRNGRIGISAEHDDFPALLAEALDTLAAAGMEFKPASQRLRCTSSQLVRFLKKSPAAWTLVVSRRRELGLPQFK